MSYRVLCHIRYALRCLHCVSHIGFCNMKWQWCVQEAWKVAYSAKWSVLVARKSNTIHRGCNYISFVPLKIPSNRRWSHQMFSDDDVSSFFIVKNYNFEELTNTKAINYQILEDYFEFLVNDVMCDARNNWIATSTGTSKAEFVCIRIQNSALIAHRVKRGIFPCVSQIWILVVGRLFWVILIGVLYRPTIKFDILLPEFLLPHLNGRQKKLKFLVR